jgi:hypothetical protein
MSEPGTVAVVVLAPIEQLERREVELPVDRGLDVGHPQRGVGPTRCRRAESVQRFVHWLFLTVSMRRP